MIGTAGLFACICLLAGAITAGPVCAQPIKPLPQQPKAPLKKLPADLTISNVKVTPEHPRAKQDMITIEITVKNAGAGTLPKTCSLAVNLTNEDTKPDYHHQIIPWYRNNIPQLAPGAEVKISNTITIPYAGKYKLSMLIITEGLQVGDEKPENNRMTVYFNATEPTVTDLVLDGVTLNQNGRIALKMHNADGAIPDQDFETSYVKIKVLDTGIEKTIKLKEMDPTGILKRGKSSPFGPDTYLTFVWPDTGSNAIKLERGTAYIVEVTLDFNRRIRDSDYLNNIKTVTLTYNP